MEERHQVRVEGRFPMKHYISPLVMIIALVTGSPRSHAQSGGAFDLCWSTVDGGGAMFSTGGAFEIGGSVGQCDSGILAGGGYEIIGGFWGGATTSAVIPPTPVPDYDTVKDSIINAKDLLQIYEEIGSYTDTHNTIFDFARFWMEVIEESGK